MSGSARGTLPGTVYLVGAGPGDPKLITVRGLEILRRADVVVYDALPDPALLGEAPAQAERIPASRRAGGPMRTQAEINELLRAKALAHAVVVRLKAGDSYVFGRGCEERAFLRECGIPVEVVPGISSAFAAAVAAHVPLTHRVLSQSVALVAARAPSGSAGGPDWGALARIDTLVILMGLESAGEIAERLTAAGRDPQTPALLVASATLPEQKVVACTLATLAEAAAQVPDGALATILVGAVVSLHDA